MKDGGSPITISIVIYFLFIMIEFFLCAYFSAVKSSGENDLLEYEENRVKQTWVRKMRDNPEILESTIYLSEIFFSLITGYIILTNFSKINSISVHTAARAGILLTGFFLFCVLGIGLPKILGGYFYKAFLFRTILIVKFTVLCFMPIRIIVNYSVSFLSGIFGVQITQIQDDVTEEEIICMVNEGHEQGVLEANEAEMINNIFEFGDKSAQDIMTHRKHIVGVEGSKNLKEALAFMLEEANSRFPVYEDTIDNITGIIHLKDAMKYHTKQNYEEWLIKDIPGLIRQAVFIPETRKINSLFQNMQSKKLQMVIVADEYGQTAGLVALEDILEEIVGNIQDEYDIDETHIVEQADGSYVVDGMTPLEELEEKLNIKFLLQEDIETLNGYLISKLDKIPSENDHSIVNDLGYSFHILNVAYNTIEKVKITQLTHLLEKEELQEA